MLSLLIFTADSLVFTGRVRQERLVGRFILNHRTGIFEILFKGLDPSSGRMGEVTLAFQ